MTIYRIPDPDLMVRAWGNTPKWAEVMPCPVDECGGTGFIEAHWMGTMPCIACAPTVWARQEAERAKRAGVSP